MSNQLSPGPWRATPDTGNWNCSNDDTGSSCYQGIRDANDVVIGIAVAHDPTHWSRPDPGANASVMASAHELLTELIICRNDLARQAAELRQSVTVPGTAAILDEEDETLCEFEESRIARLDALIARAKGGPNAQVNRRQCEALTSELNLQLGW